MARKNHAGSEGFEDVSSYSSSKEYKKRKKNRRRKSRAPWHCCVLLPGVHPLRQRLGVCVHQHFGGASPPRPSPRTTALWALIPRTSSWTTALKTLPCSAWTPGPTLSPGRSDVIMILSVDNRHGKLKLTSILRDSEVTIEGEGYQSYVNYTDKINAAYSLGGPKLAIRTLNQNFGPEHPGLCHSEFQPTWPPLWTPSAGWTSP